MRTGASIVLLASVLASCSARTGAEAFRERAAAIVGGDVDETHSGVVAIGHASSMDTCSGVLVAPRIVVTAGHCVASAAPGDLRVTVGTHVDAPDQVLGVARVALYPGVSGTAADETGGIDLGAIYLESDASAAPMTLRTDALPATIDGTEVDVIGYGDDDGATSEGAGTRRHVVVPVDHTCARLLRLGDGTRNACTGDSGGAVLLGDEVVAIVSFGREGCFAPTGHTRLDVHAAWIRSVLAGTPDAPCPACLAADDACDEIVPAPPPSGSAPPSSVSGANDLEPSGGCEITRSDGRSAFVSMALAIAAALRRRLNPRTADRPRRPTGTPL